MPRERRNLRNTMNLIFPTTIAASLMACASVFAQTGDMSGMDMKAAPAQKAASGTSATAQTDATVNSVDPVHSKVTLSHGPIANFGWPAMTMGFTVKDKVLFDKLAVGKKVHVELKKEGSDYIVTSVK